MRCRQCERLIQKKLDGDISEKESVLLAEHLAGCAACRTALADYEWIAGTLAAEAPREEESISVAVMSRIRTPHRRFRPGLVIAAAVAAAILVTGALLMMKAINHSRTTQNVDQQVVQERDGRRQAPVHGPSKLADVKKQFVELDVVGKGQTMIEDNVETLRADAQTTRDALAETLEDFTRDFPLL